MTYFKGFNVQLFSAGRDEMNAEIVEGEQVGSQITSVLDSEPSIWIASMPSQMDSQLTTRGVRLHMQLDDVGYMYKNMGVLSVEAPVQHAGGVKALALSNKYGILCCGLSSGECS